MSALMDLPASGTAVRTPLLDLLRAGLGPAAFSCPGHKGGAGALPALREVIGDRALASDVWLDTTTYDELRRDLEQRIARLWSADRAFALVNGSTSGNHALLLSTLAPGDEVVVARDAHLSTHTALVLTGASPVWVSPRVGEAGIGSGIHAEDFSAALARHPYAALAWVVSPSYAGVSSDLPELAEIARSRAVPFAVDEAWGPHLRFCRDLAVDAMAAGADAAVTSTHKLLTSLSQSSVLVLREGVIDVGRTAHAVRMTQTTSPYLGLVASIEACVAQLEEGGEALVRRAVDLARLARHMLSRVPGVRVLGAREAEVPEERQDPCKIVLEIGDLGLDGPAAETLLRARGVAPEGSDSHRLYLVVGPGDGVDSVRHLVLAVAGLRRGVGARPLRPVDPTLLAPPGPGDQLATPREAYFAPSAAVALRDAVGRVAAELVTPYPPGVPVLAPGERISGEAVDYLRGAVAAGVHIHGPDDPRAETVRVLA